MQTKRHYSRDIEMPTTKRDGLANFVQIVINKIEAGEHREALLQAVDLLEDVNSGLYDDAMTDAKGYSAQMREMQAKHDAEIIAAHQRGKVEGIAEEKRRMAEALKLVTA